MAEAGTGGRWEARATFDLGLAGVSLPLAGTSAPFSELPSEAALEEAAEARPRLFLIEEKIPGRFLRMAGRLA